MFSFLLKLYKMIFKLRTIQNNYFLHYNTTRFAIRTSGVK
jgi:hypothetical protein